MTSWWWDKKREVVTIILTFKNLTLDKRSHSHYLFKDVPFYFSPLFGCLLAPLPPSLSAPVNLAPGLSIVLAYLLFFSNPLLFYLRPGKEYFGVHGEVTVKSWMQKRKNVETCNGV